MSQGVASNIKTVVMLMLENRSLDNLFGWLYTDGTQPAHVFPQGSSPQFDGIPPGASNPAFNWLHELREHRVEQVPAEKLRAHGHDPCIIPWWDPTEEILSYFHTGHGVINQLFGDQHRHSEMPPPGTQPRMRGFLQDYWEIEAEYPFEGRDILWTFGREQLPNLYRAAEMGAISDAWFASVPTDTNPNRAFSLCGTSLGRDRDSKNFGIEQFDVPTLFNALAAQGKSCNLYYHQTWANGQPFTQYTFPQSASVLGTVANIQQFVTDANAGKLAACNYLEPQWGGGIAAGVYMVQGNDLHPPTSVSPGDQFVGDVISTLVNSPQWPNTLLILTFDEHGGTYDHVPPPWGAANPDGHTSPRFNFDLFGVRVPTILISPWIAPRTVFRSPSSTPFDHTSVISSLMAWCGGDASAFGLRAAAAPTFWDVLSDTDSSAQIRDALSAPLPAPPPPVPARTANALFEGMGFASIRWIIKTSRSHAEVVQKIEDYRRDPAAFEAALATPAEP